MLGYSSGCKRLFAVILASALVLSTLLSALPAAADKIDSGMPPDQRESIEQPQKGLEPPDPGSQGPECRAADCHPPEEGKCDPSSKTCPPGGPDSPKRDLNNNSNDPPGPLSNWSLQLYLDPRDVFGNPYWIDPSSNAPSGGKYPIDVTIDDGTTTTTQTVWCNYGSGPGWCAPIGPFSNVPNSVTIDPPGLLDPYWYVVSGPGTYSSTDLVDCGNPCEIPIVLQIKDLFIHLTKFWYGPEPPGSPATYTIETGLGTFTITCPGTSSREYCIPYPLILEDWALANPADRWIRVQEDGLPDPWNAVEEFGVGSWDGSEPPRSGFYYYDFGNDWYLTGGDLFIETLNLNTADPQPPAGDSFILEFRKEWVGAAPPNAPAQIQLTFYPEGHWLHQVRTFTCPGTAAVETCYQINLPYTRDEDDFFANFTMTITELSGPPGWTPTGNFGTYDAIGLFELLGCTPDDCPDIPPACRLSDKEGPPILICTITLTNQGPSGGGGDPGGGSGGGDEGDSGSASGAGGGSGGQGGGVGSNGNGQSSSGNATSDPSDRERPERRASDDTATWAAEDTAFAQNTAYQVLPRTGFAVRPVPWWLLCLLAIVPTATGLIASRVTRRPS